MPAKIPFTVPIFDYPLQVHICPVADMARRQAGDYEDAEGLFFPDARIIWIREGLTDKATYSIIWHESLHVANHVISFTGCKASIEDDELSAYLQGYIAMQIISRINKGGGNGGRSGAGKNGARSNKKARRGQSR